MLEKAKAKGMDPVGLRERPDLPWYYGVILSHFHRLSARRGITLGIGMDKGQSCFTTQPNPIDILTILRYNSDVAKMDDPDVFLHLMESLDDNFLGNAGR